MAVILARHGERLDYAELGLRAAGETGWFDTAARPWDPPLTPLGHRQAAALGRAASRSAEQLGLPPLTRIFVSPFQRCVETGLAVADAAGIPSVRVEPSLAEALCDSFFRSWCVPGADSTWGGPAGGSQEGAPKDEDLRPEALGPASGLLPFERVGALRAGKAAVDLSYEPFLPLPALSYRWGGFESEEKLGARMKDFFDFAAESFPKETVMLVSHGGPTQALFERAVSDEPSPMCGYCGFHVLRREAGGDGWAAPVVGEMAHVKELSGGDCSGQGRAAPLV